MCPVDLSKLCTTRHEEVTHNTARRLVPLASVVPVVQYSAPFSVNHDVPDAHVSMQETGSFVRCSDGWGIRR